MRRPRNGATLKQVAYAQRVFGAKGKTKKDIALDVGYSVNTSNSVMSHIEKTEGFNLAMAKLAMDSNNLALAALAEFKARGFENFTNNELIGSLNAIGNAWSRFTAFSRGGDDDGSGNKKTSKLRTIVLQQIENQTVNNIPSNPPEVSSVEEKQEENNEGL